MVDLTLKGENCPMLSTIIVKDQSFLEHKTRSGHPESPERLSAIYAALEPDIASGLYGEVLPREATFNEIALNHSHEYIERIEKTSGREYVSLDPDTHTSAGTWKAAILSVGAVLTGIEHIQRRSARNAFALVRPPGHHAERNHAMGFCIFNNIAIGALYLQTVYKVDRILIVDWDLHHGNGTQNAFYASPHVCYLSIHQYPYYPGTGSFDEIGEGDGKGYTINIPLSGGQGNRDYHYIFEEVVTPVAYQFKPQFILVSAGYDIYRFDPLGTMDVTPYGFYMISKTLVHLAESLCEGKILFTLEGGYHPQGLAESVRYTLRALHNRNNEVLREVDAEKSSDIVFNNTKKIVSRIKKTHFQNWKLD